MLKASPEVGTSRGGCRVDVADGLLGGGDRGAGLLRGDLQRVLVVGVAALRAGELLELAFQLGLLDQPGLAGADRGDFRVAVRVVIGCLDRPDGGVAVLDDRAATRTCARRLARGSCRRILR